MSIDLENTFSHHAPKGDQAQRYEQVRSTVLQAAIRIRELTPKSAEQTLAIRDLQMAMMHANAASAIHE